MKFRLIVLLLLSTAACFAGKPAHRNWQTGKLVDAQQVTQYTGSRSESSSRLDYDGQVRTRTETTPAVATRTGYILESETLTYQLVPMAPMFGKGALSGPEPLTLNVAIKYADDGRFLYILDERGKEHKMLVNGRAARR